MPASAARNPLPVQLLTIHPQQFRQRIDNFLFTAQRNNRTPIHGGVTPFVDAEIDRDNRIPAGHAAFFNSFQYTTFDHSSSTRVRFMMPLPWRTILNRTIHVLPTPDRTYDVLPTQMGQVNLTEATHCENLKAFA